MDLRIGCVELETGRFAVLPSRMEELRIGLHRRLSREYTVLYFPGRACAASHHRGERMGPIRWKEIPVEKLGEGVERQVIWGDKCTLARFQFAKGVHIPPHKHEAEQQTYVLEGAMRISAAGREFELHAGEVLVIPTWIEHEVWFLEKCVVLDFFAPPRTDWKEGRQAYLKGD